MITEKMLKEYLLDESHSGGIDDATLREYEERYSLVKKWANRLGVVMPPRHTPEEIEEKSLFGVQRELEAPLEKVAFEEIEGEGPKDKHLIVREEELMSGDRYWTATYDGFELVWVHHREKEEADRKAREAEAEARRMRPDPSDFSSGGGYSKVR